MKYILNQGGGVEFVSPVSGNVVTIKEDGKVYINGVGGYDGTNPESASTIQEEFVFEKGTGANSAQQKGTSAVASGNYSHAEGSGTTASGNYSHAEGESTIASGQSSRAEGLATEASGYAAHAEGLSTEANGVASHAEGSFTKATQDYSHTEGLSTEANGAASHAEGSSTIASGLHSHAEGLSTEANGVASHAEGNSPKAIGDYSHAEGSSTIAAGDGAHAEGNGSGTIQDGTEREYKGAIGENAHTEGTRTDATQHSSHAEGFETQATANRAHSEGCYTTASGKNSHAEGIRTIASGDNSHSEGSNNTASGESSHTEGAQTKATSNHSHAGGFGSEVSAPRGFVHGRNIEAKSNVEGQFAVGKYNKSNSAQQLSVGIGTSDNNRKNAFEIMQNGDAYLYGVGGYSGTSVSGATKLQDMLTVSAGTYSIYSDDADAVVAAYGNIIYTPGLSGRTISATVDDFYKVYMSSIGAFRQEKVSSMATMNKISELSLAMANVSMFKFPLTGGSITEYPMQNRVYSGNFVQMSQFTYQHSVEGAQIQVAESGVTIRFA